jgi:hypothetical protein
MKAAKRINGVNGAISESQQWRNGDGINGE